MSQFPWGLGLAAASPEAYLYRGAVFRVDADSGQSLHHQLPYTGTAVTGFDADGQLVEMPADELYPVHDRVTGEMLGYPFLAPVTEHLRHNNKPFSQWVVDDADDVTKTASTETLWGMFDDTCVVRAFAGGYYGISSDAGSLVTGRVYTCSVIVAPMNAGKVMVEIVNDNGLRRYGAMGAIGSALTAISTAYDIEQIEVSPGIWCIRFKCYINDAHTWRLWVGPGDTSGGYIRVYGGQVQLYEDPGDHADPYSFIPTTSAVRSRLQSITYTSAAPPPGPWNPDAGTVIAEVAGRGAVVHRYDDVSADSVKLIHLMDSAARAVDSGIDVVSYPAIPAATFAKLAVAYSRAGASTLDYRAVLYDEIKSDLGASERPNTKLLSILGGFVGHVRQLVYLRRALTDLELRNVTI